MPYSVGEKGSYGCSGYPVIKDDDKQVMGCHDTAAAAGAQIAAIEANENKTYEEKEVVTSGGGVGIKNPQAWPGTEIEYRKPKLMNKNDITEGDYVMGMTSEGIAHGRVEHIMWEGGTLGEPGTEYAIESMPPENPAMSVRVYEDNDGMWDATAYSIGMMYQDAQKLPSLEDHNMPEDMEDEMLEMSRSLFANFGKDYTKAQRLTEFGKGYKDKKGYGKDDMYKAVRTGSMVSWNSSGGRAEGKVTRIITSGTYNVPGTSVSLNASSDDPVAVIRLYRNGEPTDTIVAHKLGTLRVKS
jgi:hypothetical protein